MSFHASEHKAPALALEAEAISELSSWLQLVAARGDVPTRDERMPNAFKDQQHIVHLCSNCSSFPWQDIRAAVLDGRPPTRYSDAVVYDLAALREII